MPRYKYIAYLVILALAIAAPFVFTQSYHRGLLIMTCIFAILALGLDIVIGHMGQLSLAHGAFYGLGAYTSALLTLKAGMPVWLGFVAAIALVGVTGFIIGYIALRGLRGMYLAIVTLAFGLMLWMLCAQMFWLTGGWGGLIGIPPLAISIPLLPKFEFVTEFSYYYLVLALLLITLYLMSRFLRSRFGRAVISLRENEDLARSVGIPVLRYFVLAFTLSAMLAGLAGASYAHYLRIVNPMLLGVYYSFILLIIVVIGGSGTLWGPVIGAIIFVWLGELLRFNEALRLVFLGAVLVVFIVFMPQGIYPRLVSLWNSPIIHTKLGQWRNKPA